MGYYTEFEGEIELNKSLTIEDKKMFEDFVSKRHEEKNVPGFYCPWRYDSFDYGNGEHHFISCENGKSYGACDWLEYLIANFFSPKGYVLNGIVEAKGEEWGDFWCMEVKDNVMKRKNGKIVYED